MTLALSTPALALSVACALALAAADYFRKATPQSVPTAVLLFYFIAGQVPLLGLWAWLSASSAPWPPLGASYWRPALCDLAASLAANALFIVSVRRSPLSLVVPLMSLNPVFTLIFGAALLHEWPTPRQDFGVAVVTAGVFYLYQPPGTPLSPAAIWRNFRGEAGALPMVGVAIAWALTAPLDKMAMAQAGVARHALILVSLLAVAASAGTLLPGTAGLLRYRVPAKTAGLIGAAALTAGAGFALQLAAYQLTLVAFVEALKRVIEILAALVVGFAFFSERITAPKAIGVLLIAMGIPLMMLP